MVIVDELGYVPFDKAGADLLFGFISRRYERGSLVVTTNLPFARWSEVFLDATAAAAVIDRIVHHCHRADDQRGQPPPQGRPTEPDGSRSTEENALMGTRRDVASRRSALVRPRRDDHPTEGVPFHVAKRSLFSLPFPVKAGNASNRAVMMPL